MKKIRFYIALFLLAALIMSALSAFAEEDRFIVACIGDSITFGTGTDDPSTQSWPARLQELLGDAYDVQNYAKPGCSLTTRGVCYTKRPEYQRALDSRADAYIVMLGTNDSYADTWDAEEYEQCLTSLIEDLKAANSNTIIYLMVPPHVFIDKEERPHSQENSIIGGELKEILEKVSAGRETGLINLFDYTEDREDLICPDKLHPSTDGYREFAAYIYGAVAESFGAVEKEPENIFVIACIGDSITHGMDEETSYPGQLQKLLGDTYQVENYGKVGVSLTHMGASYFNMPEYRAALVSAADMYLIMLGTNDSYADKWNAEEYEADLKTLISSFREVNENTFIWLMIPPHIYIDKTEKLKGQDDFIISDEIMPILQRVSEEMNTGLLNLYDFTENRQDLYSEDLLHPNKEGYSEIAALIYDEIADILGEDKTAA